MKLQIKLMEEKSNDNLTYIIGDISITPLEPLSQLTNKIKYLKIKDASVYQFLNKTSDVYNKIIDFIRFDNSDLYISLGKVDFDLIFYYLKYEKYTLLNIKELAKNYISLLKEIKKQKKIKNLFIIESSPSCINASYFTEYLKQNKYDYDIDDSEKTQIFRNTLIFYFNDCIINSYKKVITYWEIIFNKNIIHDLFRISSNYKSSNLNFFHMTILYLTKTDLKDLLKKYNINIDDIVKIVKDQSDRFIKEFPLARIDEFNYEKIKLYLKNY